MLARARKRSTRGLAGPREQRPQRRQVALAQLVDAHAHLALGAGQRHRQVLAAGRRAGRGVRSNRYCTGVSTPGRERLVAHDAVIDDVEVDDRRAPQRRRARAPARPAAARAAPPARSCGSGHDHRLGAQRLDVAARRAVAVPVAGLLAVSLGPLRRRPRPCTSMPAAASALSARQPSLTSTPASAQRARGRLADRSPRAPRVEADVARVGARQQAVLEHERAERQRGLAAGQVQGRQRDQVPQRGDRSRSLPVALRATRRTCTSSSAFARRGRGARARARRAPRQALGEATDGGSGRARPRGAAAPAAIRGAAPQGSAPGLSTGISSRACTPTRSVAAEPLEQRAIGRAAAQEDVLAVVHPQAVALERVGRAAEPAPHLDAASPARRRRRSRAPR